MSNWTAADTAPPKDGYYLAYVRYRTFLGSVLWTQEALLWTASHGWNVPRNYIGAAGQGMVRAWMPLPDDPDPTLVPRE